MIMLANLSLIELDVVHCFLKRELFLLRFYGLKSTSIFNSVIENRTACLANNTSCVDVDGLNFKGSLSVCLYGGCMFLYNKINFSL